MRRGGTRNYFYVEMSGTTSRIEEIVVVGGQYVFYVFYVEYTQWLMRNPVVVVLAPWWHVAQCALRALPNPLVRPESNS
jgi:hypothetical protein